MCLSRVVAASRHKRVFQKIKLRRVAAKEPPMKIWRHPLGNFMTVYLLSFGCQRHVADKEVRPFQIVATDTGFEAPDRLAAGLRHIVLENRGTEIHEGMLVKLPNGMSADDYVMAVKKGSLFPEGALDYSGLGLTSPGVTAEMWLRVDPGQYIIICWNKGHDKTTPVHGSRSRKPEQPMIGPRKKMSC